MPVYILSMQLPVGTGSGRQGRHTGSGSWSPRNAILGIRRLGTSGDDSIVPAPGSGRVFPRRQPHLDPLPSGNHCRGVTLDAETNPAQACWKIPSHHQVRPCDQVRKRPCFSFVDRFRKLRPPNVLRPASSFEGSASTMDFHAILNC